MHARIQASAPVVFFGGLLVVLAGVLLQVWAEILPGGIAARIGHNSEAYVLAVVLGAWIQYVRPRLHSSAREWTLTGAVSLACLAVGVGLIASDWPNRFRTLNEAFLALVLLVPYVQPSRRPSRGVATGLAVAVVLVVVLAHGSGLGVDLAEMLGMIMLAAIAFDVVDRGILDPDATTSSAGRLTWYVVLVVTPITLSALEYALDVGAAFGELTRYGVRIHEAFIAMLLLEGYFAVLLGRTGARSRAPLATAVTAR